MRTIPNDSVPEWRVVTDPERDMPAKEQFDADPMLYIIIGVKGLAMLAYPVYARDGRLAFWQACNGPKEKYIAFPENVFAYAPACIPKEIVDETICRANVRSTFRMVYQGRTEPIPMP